ncbi:hypothetical protein HanXRQr2_Chr03g0135751 [Helianthus annuus]|uniref:Uncharacterized protein n=1 Tax=Helianthus annuus TaxID=4232 RepID=A0A9K3JKL8_HELAN|nr:hypothetical protein HanXRQr2_Chr03g0135751 [Helianthus annuus]KAJ0945817.1 hypothetical protein HanPSC8_Chr03g0132301 [Helianthus annuus]
MTSSSNGFLPPVPPSRLSMGPTGYTGGMVLSADNDSIACVSTSKNELTIIALTSLILRAADKTNSTVSLVWNTVGKTFVGIGLTNVGTVISVSEWLNSTTSWFCSSLSVWIKNLNPRKAALEVKNT